jgi:hypothetical protein
LRKLFVLAGLLLCACAEDLPFPPAIVGVRPSEPSNLSVTTLDDMVFTLTWTVSNPATVQFYRLYSLDPIFGQPVFADTTAVDSVQVVTPIPTPGIVFGVSSVSTDNIESRIVYGSAP